MQICPNCDKVYDPTEYSRCPYCSGELEEEHGKDILKDALTVMVQCIGMVVGNALTAMKKFIQVKMTMMVL